MARRIQIVDSHGRASIRLDCGQTFGSVMDLCTHRALKTLDRTIINRLVDMKPFNVRKPIDILAMLVIAKAPYCIENDSMSSERTVDGPVVIDTLRNLLEHSAMADELCEQISTHIIGRYAATFMNWYGRQLQARGIPLE